MGVWTPGPGATAGDDTFTGDGTDEVALGLAGADTLNGGAGNDTLNGGAGADTLNGGDGVDTASYSGASGGVVASLATPGVNTGDAAGDTYIAIENLIGSGQADQLTGDGNANFLDGSAGADALFGGAGDDSLEGGSENDTLDGGDGADRLDGESGADNMSGGIGDDVYLVDNVGDVVTESSGAGDDRVASSISYTLGANVERLTLLGVADLTAQGNALDNTIVGNDGSNLIDGGQGADVMTGGKGDDQYFVDNVGDVVSESTATTGGIDLVHASISYTLPVGVENLLLTGATNINATGNTLNNTITGNSGNNVINGGAGADAMSGAGGNDTYVVDNIADTVFETNASGTDTVQSSVNWTLGSNVENLTLTGTAITGAGNELSNVITGNAEANTLSGEGGADTLYGGDGNDSLDGGAGADTMFGGLGDDTYIVDSVGDVASEASALGGIDLVLSSLTRNLTANIENLTLTGNANIIGYGNVLNNVITGNGGANSLYGFDGNDRLDGGVGADTMFGANGDDTYVVDNVNDITVEGSALGGIDTVESSIDRNLNANFENLTLTGTAQYGYGNVLDNLMTGNASSNSLYGFDGNDTLDGGAGADFMFGANGDDTYIVDNAGDVTSETSPSGGIDTVISSVTRNLTANLENLVLTGAAAITGAGNALNNVITGNSGANTLYGLDGADTLNGGLGADTLQGGTGADDYVFSTALGGGNVDSIVGFSVVDDTIVLSNAIFTGLAAGTLAADNFAVGAAAADADDRVIYNSATGALYFDADGNGGGAAVQFATLAAGLALTNDDFIVSGP